MGPASFSTTSTINWQTFSNLAFAFTITPTLLGQGTLNGKPALDIAGNGRYARQLVEAGEQSRDMRLARSLDFDSLGVEQLSEINGEDMASAIAAVHSRLNISG